MGDVIQGVCGGCAYASQSMQVGLGGNPVFLCANCNSAVSAPLLPYRFEMPLCPQCAVPLKRASRIYPFMESRELYTCPRCKQELLKFQRIKEFKSKEQVMPIPKIGQFVHGKYEGKRWVSIEGRGLLHAALSEEYSDLAEGTPLECEVLNATKDGILLQLRKVVDLTQY